MIVMQAPQFPTQDGSGRGNGIAPIPQWYEATNNKNTGILMTLDVPLLDPDILDITCRLHNLFESDQYILCNTDLHDLTCFVVHKLLLWSPQPCDDNFPYDLIASGSIRHALVLYMLIIQGPTYFTHARLQYATALKLQVQLEHTWYAMLLNHSSLALWLLSVGIVACDGLPEGQWFTAQARTAIGVLFLQTWDDVKVHLKEIVWLDSRVAEPLFQRKWDEIWAITPT